MPGTVAPMSGDTPAQVMPDLDDWLPVSTLQLADARSSTAAPGELWAAARSVPLAEARRLARLVHWRIPGLAPGITFDELFRSPPFMVLEEGEHALVSGLVGRIWTLRRDYPQLGSVEEFRAWERRGTARVVFANWVHERSDGRSSVASEARVQAIGTQGRLGVSALRPVVQSFGHLIGSDGLSAAVRRAERG